MCRRQQKKAYELDKKRTPKDDWTNNTLNATVFVLFQAKLQKAAAYKVIVRSYEGDCCIESHIQGEKKESYLVKTAVSSMFCSCHYPTTMLLPCEHIIAANYILFQKAFVPTQLHPRWLRVVPPTASLVTPPQAAAAAPSQPSSSTVAANKPAVNVVSTVANTTVTTAIEEMNASHLYYLLRQKCEHVIKLVMNNPAAFVKKFECGLEMIESYCYQNTHNTVSNVPLSSSTPHEITKIYEPLLLKKKHGRSSNAASSINPKNKVKNRRVRLSTTSSSVTTISAVNKKN